MSAILLLSAVAFAWLGCLGFAGFRTPYDRLHCVTFVAVTAGFFVTLSAFAADGLSDRTLKILLFFLLTLANGAAVAHATSRAMLRRGPSNLE